MNDLSAAHSLRLQQYPDILYGPAYPTLQHPDILYGPYRPELLQHEILADVLEASALRAPEHVALIFGERRLSYRELNQQADLVASRLIDAGVAPGQIVGLWLPRGLDLLVMQAGIAKAGAAWLPVDQDTPVERLQVCLDDAHATGVLSCEQFAPELTGLTSAGVLVWTCEALLAPLPTGTKLARRGEVAPTDPAYVIYTSGSTGKPKGIVISQRSICHFLRSENAVLGIDHNDIVYQGFSVAFDMSFEEIWIAYLVGATLWIAPREASVDPEILPGLLTANRVSVLHAVPTLLALFNADVPSLRLINLGGEMCPDALVEKWDKPGRQLFNSYGPTEATVSASLAQLHRGHAVTIGTPLPNYGLLIIEVGAAVNAAGAALRLLARGDTGELCITGPGLADGYLGRRDLSAEKFLPNPWSGGPADAKLYRTGDLARIDPDGRVQCLGRADDQVKIRGFRVELGEIEALLAQQAGVGTVAVLLRRDDGMDQLVAYIVLVAVPVDIVAAPAAGTLQATGALQTADVLQTVRALRTALSLLLPSYMVPGRFEVLDAMPRLTSGKIDRKALKAVPLGASNIGPAQGSDVAATPSEAALFAALAKLFPGQPIWRDADFFSDLGGHSFLAARLASSLRLDPNYAHVTVRDIYQNRQLGRIAAVLADVPEGGYASEPEWIAPSAARRWRCAAAQAVAVPGLVTLHMAQWLAPFFTYHFFTGDAGDSIPRAIAASVGVFLIVTLLEFLVAIVGKWLIAGRLKAGSYPLWGLTYYRWWLADRLVEAAPVYLLSGSSLYAWWLRALGAAVGSDVIIGSVTLRAPDLLTIKDGVSIGNAVNLENARVERGRLLLGNITLGKDACVSSYAVLEGNTSVAEAGHLEGQSALADGHSVPAGRIWSGSPARDAGAFDPAQQLLRPVVGHARLALEALFFLCGIVLIVTLFFMPVFPTFVLIDELD
ncbi:MAG: amino acid adenylation domain-containing protein, partial [Janthinobacterium sp.]